MNFISIIGLVAAFLTTGAFVPQAVKTIRTKSTEDLSLATFSMMFSGTICWFIYGWYISDLPLILANLIASFLTGTILVLKLRGISIKNKYSKNNNI
ncbi:MAG: SemiSWEET transporter [Saprospiraceae bacterium]|nr:SemiSWEET transporter [Saprospiraceae bacterium]